MKKTLVAALLGLSLGAASSHATVNLSLYGGVLRDGSGTALADGGLLVLVASTTDSIFSAPLPDVSISVGSLFGGDDQIVGLFSISADNSGMTGGYGSLLNLNYSGNLTAGDNLQLYWFPTLTTASTSFGSYTPYGAYRTDAIASGSDIAWVLPSDGASVALNFFTSSSGFGTEADSLGNASLSTIPEPATTVALLGGAAALFVAFRRRQQRKPAPATATTPEAAAAHG
jgi:hypothetical protein